jgi:hypothetical protein
LVGTPAGKNVYIDNIYFYKAAPYSKNLWSCSVILSENAFMPSGQVPVRCFFILSSVSMRFQQNYVQIIKQHCY